MRYPRAEYHAAHSSDLQPIENVWCLLAQREDIQTTDDLRAAIEEEWARLGPKEIAPFVQSMQKRLDECLAAGGAQTHY